MLNTTQNRLALKKNTAHSYSASAYVHIHTKSVFSVYIISSWQEDISMACAITDLIEDFLDLYLVDFREYSFIQVRNLFSSVFLVQYLQYMYKLKSTRTDTVISTVH